MFRVGDRWGEYCPWLNRKLNRFGIWRGRPEHYRVNTDPTMGTSGRSSGGLHWLGPLVAQTGVSSGCVPQRPTCRRDDRGRGTVLKNKKRLENEDLDLGRNQDSLSFVICIMGIVTVPAVEVFGIG